MRDFYTKNISDEESSMEMMGVIGMKSDVTPGMEAIRARKFRQIEKKFGQPFWTVVRGFAAQGYGRMATARAIGYTEASFSRLVKHEDIDWPTARDAIFNARQPGSEEGAANIAAARDKRTRRYYVRGQWRTVTEIAEIAGVGKNSIYLRIYRGILGDALADKAMPLHECGKKGAAVANRWASVQRNEQEEKARELWLAGAVNSEIARAAGVPIESVWSLARRWRRECPDRDAPKTKQSMDAFLRRRAG